MPVEIRELVIKTTVRSEQSPGNHSAKLSARELDRLVKSITAECTRRVWEKIESKIDR